jgi:cytochrome P450
MLPKWVPLPSRRRLADTRNRLDEIVLEIIRRKRATPGSDLLSELMLGTDENGRAMSDAELRDESMTLFLAGHETTALALTYTFHLLATHPAAYERLLAEIDGVLGEKAPTNESVQRLEFTNAVLRESLRLYPPVWAMARETTRDVNLLGLAIPAHTQVILSQWVVQRDARHFPDPEAFKPERWLSGECRDLPRFAYFPFGGGPRVCVGQHFALLEATILLARISQTFRVERADSAPLVLSPVITLRPLGPVPFLFRKRGGARAAAAE